MPYALLIFVAMPIIEIAVLLNVGAALGWLPTLAIVVLTAVLGTLMLRQQGLATLNKARQRLNSGEMPAEQMLEGMLLLVGGVLLLTPGFVTDAFGFACLLPFSRRWLANRIASRSLTGFVGAGGFVAGGVSSGPTRSAPGQHGTTVGSGSTASAVESESSDSPRYDNQSGGRPNAGNTAQQESKVIIDADFKRVDD